MNKPFTLSRTSKRVDNFYVNFKKLPENISNILGAQINTISRPEISFDTQNRRVGRNQMQNVKQNVRFEPVTVTFFDDEQSVVSMFLYYQIFRQMNKTEDVFNNKPNTNHKERDFKFDVEVEVFSPNGELVEKYVLKDCFIQSITHSEHVVVDDADNEITIILNFDNIDIQTFDRIKELLENLNETV